MKSDIRVLPTIALSFDASLGEIFRTLLAGGTLCLARREELLPGPDLIRLLRDQHITTTTLVTAVLAALPAEEELPELRTLVVGGEALSAELAARWSQGRRLLNGYGPTEATIGATLAWGWDPARKPPLGKPLPNVRAYVLDTRMQLLPVGVPGELYLGGPGLARGYLNRPDLTAERFLADPFSGEPSARLYRTGDRVRWLPDGQLEFMGRVDEQVKVRGFRIEPGEIEGVLRRHPGVRQAVVLAREDTPGDKRLVAYYIVEPDADETGAEELRQHLSAALPEYMVPAAYVRLDTLPLTANGKLNRRALPAPDAAAYAAAREYEAPAGEIEIRLARIWADVLKLERVGRHDDFFKLGGHSLLAVTMIPRMRQAGLQVDVRALFTTPTLAAFAAAVGNNDGVVEVPPNRIPPGCDAITPEMLTLVSLTAGELDRIVGSVPGGAGNIQDIYPLAPLQEGLLFHHLIGSKGNPYLGEQLFGFDSRTRLDRYLDALRAVIARHDILRTAVLWEGLAEPVQVVWREAPLIVEEVTLDPADGDVAEQMRLRFGRRQFRLDVRQAPLMRLFIAHDAVHHHWVVLKLAHQLLGDHTTLEVMQQEIQAHLLGRAEKLSAPLPFRNLVAQARMGVSREEHEAFFRDMLGDVEEPTVPFGLDVRGDGSDIGESRRAVDPALAKRLRTCARALGVSAASLYHLAWALVMARVSGREDVVFGTVLFGRMQGGEGSDRVLGPFINTLPVRIRISEEGVADSVRHVHGLLAKLLRHEHAPLVLAQRCSAVAAPTPLFAGLLNYRHSAGQAKTRLGGEERTTYPFTLNVDDLGEGFVLTAQVRSPIDPEWICAFVHMALEQLSSALENAPTTPVRRLDVLPSAERRQVFVKWNQTQADYPRHLCLHQLFEIQAEKTPDAIALKFEGVQLSYGELNRRANQLAHYLRGVGVGAETLVGLCVERSVEMVVGLLGILKAGGAYVPLDPTYPQDRLAFMLADTQADLLLTQQNVLAQLGELASRMICLDRDQSSWESLSPENPENVTDPKDLAYVLYTSGSTGIPKGVLGLHRGAVNRLAWMWRTYPFAAGEVSCQKTSLNFVDSVWELFGPLLQGIQTVLIPDEVLKASERLIQILANHQVTRIVLVPSLLSTILDTTGDLQEQLVELQLWITSGEALGVELLSHFRRRLPHSVLLNLYGSSEVAADVTWYDTQLLPARSASVPIGRPIANTQIYVLDPRLQPVPIGVPGELYVGGDGLARGYWNRTELTAERFIPHPFSSEPGARLYKTGDLARYLPEGIIEYLGRIDQQIKVRGYRIEPGEIEVVLRGHSGVRQAVVVATTQQHLAAYVVAAEGQAPTAAELREFALQHLPEYMVPGLFMLLQELPLTPSGKLNRRALPGIEATATTVYVQPGTSTEQAVAAVWADVLRKERVGIHDNFFELGGHSLLAMRVLARLRSAVGVDLPIPVFFNTPTVAGLAEWIEANRHSAMPDGTPPLIAAAPSPDGRREAPQSFAQQRLWFLAQLASRSPLYSIQATIPIRGALDLNALERTLTELVRRHESLRTTFGSRDGEPIQIVAPPMPVYLSVVDLRSLPAGHRQAELQRVRRAESTQPFDLARGPLIRFRLVRLEEQRQVLLLAMHHINTDGWSMGVLRGEVQALYEAFRAGQPSPLPELTLQYADFVVWQRQWLQGEVLKKQLSYWKEKLAGAERLELPIDRPRPAAPSYASARQPFRIESEVIQKLRDLGQQEEATLFMVLLATFQVILGRYSGQDDVVVGTPIANRTRTELEGLIGFFVNTLVMRTDLSGDCTFRQLLQRVRQTCLEAYTHQDLPFEKLVEELSPQRDLGRQPLFEVLFVMQNTPEAAPPSRQHSKATRVDTPDVAGLIYFDLTLSVTETASALSGALHFNTELFDQSTAERMVRHFQTLLAAVADQPDHELSGMSMLSEQERQELLLECNASVPASPDCCIHHLVEEQVDRAPDHIAVTFEGQELSYRDLDRRANQLAHRLRALGVRPEVPVGLYLERGPEAIVGLLGILKAGGVYLPLDPGLPSERLAWLLDDARPAVLLTQMALHSRLPECQASVLYLDDPQAELLRELNNRPVVEVTPTGLAYIIYTSGSTGRPKGVMIEHRSLSHTITAQLPLFGLTPDGQTLAAAGAIPQPLECQSRVVAGHAPALQNEPDRTLAI